VRHPSLLILLTLWACGTPDASAPEAAAEPVRLARLPDPPPVHRGDDTPPPLSLAWVDEPGAPVVRDTLTLRLTSLSDTPLTARVRLAASGLDDRELMVELGSVALPARGTRLLSVRAATLPLQSTTHSVQLIAAASFAYGEDTLSVPSSAIAYHFEAGFGRAVVYSLDQMARALEGGVVVRGRAPEARSLEGGISRALTPRALTEVQFVTSLAPVSSARTLTTADPTLAALDPNYCQNNPWNCCSGANCVDVCADWRTSYVDASASHEDYAKQVPNSIYQAVDAAYARFQVEDCGGSVCAASEPLVTDEYFGPDGCALVDLVPGSLHRLSVFTEHRRQGVVATTHYYSANTYDALEGVTVLKRQFTPQAKAVQDVYTNTLPYHAAANAAAAVSRALVVAKPGGPFTVKAGVGCNGGVSSGGIPATDACAGGDTLNTGPATLTDGTPGRLRWKFVIGHELGHVYQSRAGAMPNNSAGYCFSSGFGYEAGCGGYVDPAAATSPLCRCDHVTGSNKLHCMQSLERDAAAQIEGFGHYFSARLWNDAGGTDCDFSYYKQFNAFLLVATAVVQPPVHLDCREQVRWRDTFCYAQGMSTEYDWLGFLWNVNTVGTNTVSLTDLFEIWKLANQASSTITWAQLQTAAATHLGAGSAKYTKFVADADKLGVDGDRW
jgi:hypothetical protein